MTQLEHLHVFKQLINSPHSSLQSSAELGDGLTTVIWKSQHDDSHCLTPNHHTLASYLGDTPTQHSAAHKGLCIRSAGQQSAWLIKHTEPLAHLYISQEQFALTIVQLLDKEPRALQLDAIKYLDDPLQKLRFRQLFLMDWQEPAERLLGNSIAHDLIQHALLSYADRCDEWRHKGGLAPNHRRRVGDYIQANLHTPMTLGELARLCALSEFHFARMFQLSFGLPPHRYVLAQRLLHARHLLRHSPLALPDIAHACGFASPSHFNNRFRKALGATPGQYRSVFSGH